MYYPLSQIVTDLYTNGNKLQRTSNGEIYSGFYWKTSTGKFYSGKNPQDEPIEELISYIENTKSTTQLQVKTYSVSFNNLYNTRQEPKPRYQPYYSPVIPTEDDYKNGFFTRYFCKKNNEIIYLEINKQQAEDLKNPSSDAMWDLYTSFSIPWAISGDKPKVYTTNKNYVEGYSFRANLIKFPEYLNFDYIKYLK